jgi:hypothetical protein
MPGGHVVTTAKSRVPAMDYAHTPGVIVNRPDKHRDFLRFPIALPAKCLFSVAAAPASCRLVDVCAQGLGLEIDAPVKMHRGQTVLLKIDIAPGPPPVSIITELTWVRRRKTLCGFQRAGSRLLSIDPVSRQRLLDYAHDALISWLIGSEPVSPP